MGTRQRRCSRLSLTVMDNSNRKLRSMEIQIGRRAPKLMCRAESGAIAFFRSVAEAVTKHIRDFGFISTKVCLDNIVSSPLTMSFVSPTDHSIHIHSHGSRDGMAGTANPAEAPAANIHHGRFASPTRETSGNDDRVEQDDDNRENETLNTPQKTDNVSSVR